MSSSPPPPRRPHPGVGRAALPLVSINVHLGWDPPGPNPLEANGSGGCGGWPACRWRPGKGIPSCVLQAPGDQSPGPVVERTWLRRQCGAGWKDPVRRNHRQRGAPAGDAHRGAQKRHVARPPRAAGPSSPSLRQVDSVAMKRKPGLSLLQTATRQAPAIVRSP